jgi:hypothetical protein
MLLGYSQQAAAAAAAAAANHFDQKLAELLFVFKQVAVQTVVDKLCAKDARHTSQVTRHTSHVTRHTSHVTRHTSHVTRHTSHVTCYALITARQNRQSRAKHVDDLQSSLSRDVAG